MLLSGTGIQPALSVGKNGLFTQRRCGGAAGKADTEGYEPDGVVTLEELASTRKRKSLRRPRLSARRRKSKRSVSCSSAVESTSI